MCSSDGLHQGNDPEDVFLQLHVANIVGQPLVMLCRPVPHFVLRIPSLQFFSQPCGNPIPNKIVGVFAYYFSVQAIRGVTDNSFLQLSSLTIVIRSFAIRNQLVYSDGVFSA